jgi:hypothetical protein
MEYDAGPGICEPSAKAQKRYAANTAVRQAERELARQAEVAYTRTVRDWHATQASKVGASATPGRASNSPQRAKPRGRPQAPDVCASLRQSLAPTKHSPTGAAAVVAVRCAHGVSTNGDCSFAEADAVDLALA